jgi:predicted esterase
MQYQARSVKSVLGLAAMAVACGNELPGNPVASGGSSVAGGAPPATGGTLSSGGVTLATGGRATGGTSSGGVATGGRATAGSTTGPGGPPGNAPVPSPGCGKTPTLTSGTKTITSASLSRQFIIDIPTDYDQNRPYRLIFGFHWYGGTMTDVATGQTVLRNVWAYYGLKQLDSPRSAIFVAPQGLDDAGGTAYGWPNTNGRDLTFTDDMVKLITEGLCIDTTRIFAGGFSYGGMWSCTLACQRTNVFRALAPQNGSGNCTNQKPIALFGAGSNDGTNASLLNFARNVARANGCANPNQTVPLPAAGSALHTCTSFEGCPAAYPVRFCAFDENHKAAPCDGCCAECDDGNKTWVPGEIWKFYTQF